MVRQWKGARRWVVLAMVVVLCILSISDAGAEGKAKRILLVGDSWPFFMWFGGLPGFCFWTGCAAQDGLNQAGYGEWDVYGGDTAVPMSMAREWRDNLGHIFHGGVMGLLDIIRFELESYPTIDIAHVSLGGNDIGRGYYNDVMPQQIRFTGAPTGGTFTLGFEGQLTGALPYNATAAQIQTAMELLSNVGTGKIQVSGPNGGPYRCVFDFEIVKYIGENTPDNNIWASSSLVGGGIMVDESHHGWEQSWGTDSDYEKLFFDAICFGIERVIRTILDVRPDIRVAFCDYDYLRINWGGTTEDRAGELETRIAGTRFGMAKFNLTQRISAMPEYRNRCFFIAPGGLMQYVFGLYSRYNYCAVGTGNLLYPCTDAGPAPGAHWLYGPNGESGSEGTIACPQSNLVKWGITEPIPGGNIDPPVDYYPDDNPDPDPKHNPHTHDISPRTAILAEIGGGDIHLNNLGYAALMKYSVEEFYREWLDQPKVLSVVVGSKSKDLNAQLKGGSTAPIHFVVTFSKPVTGVDETDFSVVMHGGVAGCQVLSVMPDTGGPYDTYMVEVSRGFGQGSITLAVIDNDTIKDEFGTPLAGNVNGYFAYGEVYSTLAHTLPVAAWPVGIALLAAATAVLRRRPRA